MNTLSMSTLRALAKAGAVSTATVVGEGAGFALLMHYGSSGAWLASARGKRRTFASLNRVTVLLKSLGIVRFDVESTQYVEGRLRKPRPDRAEALRYARTRMRQQPLEFESCKSL